MKIGKLPEPVLIRSVLKQVKHRREEVLVGPAVGQDCAALEVQNAIQRADTRRPYTVRTG